MSIRLRRSIVLGLLPLVAAAATLPDVYVVPFSHLDFFWGGTREECLARGNQIIAKAVQIAGQHPEFRFLIEDIDFVANYVEARSGSEEVEQLRRLVKEGRIEIAPKWAAIFQNLPHGEVHVRNFVYGKRYARSVFGVDPQVAHLGDLPGYTPQFPQIAARSGIHSMVMTRMGPNDKSLFHWKSPDGSKVLLWHTISHYGWGSRLGLHLDLDTKRREDIRKGIADVRATFDGPIFMSWGSDLWAPTPRLVENVNALNRDGSIARFRFATPTEFFRDLPRSKTVPELSGEIPSSWPNVVSSLAHMWPLAVPATATLLAAERFAAINYALGYADYPQADFDVMWKKLIESMDHNHDGQGGKIGDDRKIEYSQLSLNRGGEILRDMLRNIAERVEIPHAASHPIVVFNPLNWQRDDVVRAHVTLYGPVAPRDLDQYRKGMRLLDDKGQPVPFHVLEYSENISRALDLIFLANRVPALGYKTYYLVPAEAPETLPASAQITLDSASDRREPRRPMGTDLLENSFYRVAIDKPTGRVTVFDKELNREVLREAEVAGVEERGGNYIGIEPLSGRTIPAVVDRISVEENNPVRAVLKVEGRIADIAITQRWMLYSGAKRVDLENTVEWKSPRFVRVQQLFPYAQAGAQIHYGVPFGANAASNLISGAAPDLIDEISRESWLASRQILDWISAGSSDWTLTVATNHQLIKLSDGVIRSEMLRGSRHSSVRVVRGEEVTSLVYPPPGVYTFRYSLTSGRGDWRAARSWQPGMNLNNPLLPVSVVDNISSKSLPPARSFLTLRGDNLVLSTVKKSDLDKSVLLRFYDIQGVAADTPIEFLGRRRSFREINLLEEDLPGGERQAVRVGPYEIRTVKVIP